MNLFSRIGRRSLALMLLSSLLSLLLIEGVLRCFVVPSKSCYGTIFGRELPPLKIVRETTVPPPTDLSQPYDNLIVDGKWITYGDLTGFHREDQLLGYTNAENTISANGWWQTNNLGARSRSEVRRDVPAGASRMLIFGESFALASRVPQEDAWSEILTRHRPNMETMNFAVDGYSMAQAYLRFTEVKEEIDYNLVVLMLVPDADLWREINTIRDLVYDWDLPYVMPRFVIEKGKLKLISNPYKSREEFFARNVPEIDPGLRMHLRNYDRFYISCIYDEPGLIDRSVLYKMGCKAYYNFYAIPHLRRHLMDDNGEAVQVFNGIAKRMKNEVEQQGGRFVVVLLPCDVPSFQKNSLLVQKWKRMAASLCGTTVPCIDLLDEFRRAPDTDLDKGYDGTHYGPKANRLIADLIEQHMVSAGILLKGL